MRGFKSRWNDFWDKVHAFWGNWHLYIIIALLGFLLVDAHADISFWKNDIVNISIKRYDELYNEYERIFTRCEKLEDKYEFLQNEDLLVKLEEPDYYKDMLNEEISQELFWHQEYKRNR